MNSRGKLWIVPDEEQILQDVFVRDVEFGKSYTYHMQEFSDIYELGYKFGQAHYQTAPCEIALLGHVVVKSEDEVSLVICYLPDIITERQCEWFYRNQDMLNKYVQVNGYSVHLSTQDGSCFKKFHGIDEIMTEVRKKNLCKVKGIGRIC